MSQITVSFVSYSRFGIWNWIHSESKKWREMLIVWIVCGIVILAGMMFGDNENIKGIRREIGAE